MIVIYSIFVVFAITCSASGAEQDPHRYCFQFTWLGATAPETVNCTKLTHAPCIQPFVVTDNIKPPNVTYMWEHLNRTALSCPLSDGYACLKYSYTYNNVVLNATYFCGKMIEDKTSAIEDGCYTQEAGGFTVEACACKSMGGMMPCNSAIRSHSPINKLIALLIILMFSYGRFFRTSVSFDIRKVS